MTRRVRYEDTGSLGRSTIVPYRREESPSSRHARRLSSNLRRHREVDAWVRRTGIVLRISNEGHHWRFLFGERVAEWWPSSAKLVLDRNYAAGIHAHDHVQVIAYLQKEWALNGNET